ncbi:MAG: methylmalonyl-CoA mutase small subunit [Bacteroides sp.]|nr:methylmalonyl-CoA mutase small subunit [Bacteroides sp.]MBD5341719.1 methylmalonyl-CoA mutase small subunit [Bacteroides sp.]MBD5352388.1 methylmalonyl-CoA mutase small subunit [Bacteroides sp.]MBD5373625.1 methylmalonyl-CoA mutase small subunit [Bacteroides sp.]
MAENKEKLFEMFPPVSAEQWREKVDVDLKGVPFEKKLVWRTSEGFNVQPMYRREDIASLTTTDSLPGEFPYVRGTRCNNEWLIRQEIIASTPEEANAKAHHAIERGATSLGWHMAEVSAEALAAFLKDIDLTKIEINLSCCMRKAVELTSILSEYVVSAGAAKEFRGSVKFNPWKRELKHGSKSPLDPVESGKAIIEASLPLQGLRVLSVDSELFTNGGAYIFQELGYALSWGAQWLTMLTEAGVPADLVASKIKFDMGISTNYFMELAKFRAARMLWAQIVEQYSPAEIDACKMVAHATTSKYNQTIYDAHVNLLRSQTEAMSAALAGVDSITVTPFDVPFKQPDEFSERIARNQQLLLKEESHLDKVVDPAGGSYYVETLTVSLAQEAWKLFLSIEEQGGFAAALAAGTIQDAVNESNQKRHADMARRKEILLGTNQYPNINEFAAEKIETDLHGGCGCGCNHDENAGISATRLASDFEQLRLQTEHAANRPKVFMLTIGNLAMRLARSQFSGNFFGCAGYEIIDNNGFPTVKDGVDAALAAGADIVVLCSSDDEYAEFAPEAWKLLQGKAEFVVAGAPACTDDLKAQGIENFIHVRSNVLDTLRAFNAKLLK